MSNFSNLVLKNKMDISYDKFDENNLLLNILNLPRDLILLILSYNGYYDYNGKLIKKLILSDYKNISDIFEYRMQNLYRDGIMLYINITENIEMADIEDMDNVPVKLISINYGYNPVHAIQYENVSHELMENIPIDPFDRRFSIEEVDNTEEPTMFYSVIKYNCNMNNNSIIFDFAKVYMPMFNFKFDHYPYKPLNVLDMNDNEEINSTDKEDYENYFYDEYENDSNYYY
jgi:hypothetical protein